VDTIVGYDVAWQMERISQEILREGYYEQGGFADRAVIVRRDEVED